LARKTGTGDVGDEGRQANKRGYSEQKRGKTDRNITQQQQDLKQGMAQCRVTKEQILLWDRL
jgi:hypothetical protein